MSQYPQYQPQAPKKRHTVRNIFIVIGVLALVGIGGCVAVVGSVGNEIDKQANTEHTVVYKVIGRKTAAADLTYTTDSATTTEQVQSARLPWTKTLRVKGNVATYQVMAQNTAPGGSVLCSIAVDGKEVKTAAGVGQGAIASCDYTPSSGSGNALVSRRAPDRCALSGRGPGRGHGHKLVCRPLFPVRYVGQVA